MIRAASFALLVLGAGCGDNVFGATPDLPGLALAPGADLVVIAHQDDDLLFMQPDVIEAVQRGEGVTNVYVTAGNASKGTQAADIRYEGLKQAYGAAAGSFDWTCGYVEIAGHLAQHCRLEAQHVSLVFLAYPDGLVRGEKSTSLLNLWEGNVENVDTIAPLVATYDRDSLLDTLAEIVRETQPEIVRTLEIAGTHGADEHADHMVVGAATLLALGRVDAHPALLSYRGYNTTSEPANKIPPIVDVIRPILVRYEACATGCAPCGQPCTTIDPEHDQWLARRYATGFRRYARGRLRAAQCLVAGGGLGDCASAPVWTFSNGALETDGTCLAVAGDGSLAMAVCDGSVAQRLALDDEGHIWSAVPPRPQPAMDYAHADCLTPGAGAVTAALCGANLAPVWEVLPELVFSTPALPLTGHLSIGDLTGDGLGDACAIVAGELVCAPGDGTGGFGATIQLAALPIDPASLAIGDVDGDGRPDACGRSDAGTMCALAASGFAAIALAPTFGAGDERAGTSASIAVVDHAVCGAAAAGATCTPDSSSFVGAAVALLSPWPDPASTLWPGDLDGDGKPDWCATTSTGVACGVSAEATVTTDGVPWLYSTETVPDGTLARLADVDGDGLADLCNIVDGDVTCAHSQGRGFGPQATLLEASVAPTALWLGDLDGDGIADACVVVNGALACTVSR